MLQLLRQPEQDELSDHLDRRLRDLLLTDQLGAMGGMLRNYVLGRGKRIRPQLCLWTYERCRPDDAEKPSAATYAGLLDAACAWELFHAFLLVHDDIIDESTTRRGEPALHRKLASLDSDSLIFGRNLGIVAGDLLFAASMRLWYGIDAAHLEPDARCELLSLFSRIGLETGAGQAADITQSHAPLTDVAEEDVLRGYHGKTAAYTFEGPMLSGALMAGANPAVCKAIERYAIALGQAYQLQNDLLDLSGPVHEGSDLAQGKRTLTLLRARSMLGEKQRAAMDRDVTRLPGLSADDRLRTAEQLRRLVHDCGAVTSTRELIGRLLASAADNAQQDVMGPALQEGLTQLLTGLSQSYFRDITTPTAAPATTSPAGSVNGQADVAPSGPPPGVAKSTAD